MRRFLGAVLLAVFLTGLGSLSRAADDKEANAILDKAIKALGGEDKLAGVKAAAWKGKGKINVNGSDNDFTNDVTVQGLDHYRQVLDGEFSGTNLRIVTVLAGDKAWRQLGDNKEMLDKDALAAQKRGVYLQVLPVTLVPLKDKAFKLEAAGEDKVGGKPALVVKVTPPDGKEFTLSFDKESGLPVKEVAKVTGFSGEEVTQETTYADYKDFGGIKKATKIEAKRGGEKFLEQQITEFKVLDKVDPKTFEEPK
jgi:hypothetical protein